MQQEIKAGQWQRISTITYQPVTRKGWPLVWDALKAAVTGEDLTSLAKPVHFTGWVHINGKKGLFTVQGIGATVED